MAERKRRIRRLRTAKRYWIIIGLWLKERGELEGYGRMKEENKKAMNERKRR